MEWKQRVMDGSSIIGPSLVRLDLEAPDREAALRRTAELLSADPRVGNWEEFWLSIGSRQVVELADAAGSVILAHGRSQAVREVALAAARWAAPAGPRLVFVFAIPATMSEEYLRNVGALARICREPEKTDALLAAATPAEFAGLLDAWLG
jgi:mannitol/fructose-specific phosphotransferase system IIA component (Ntr-type)